jgi:hypothetical protein
MIGKITMPLILSLGLFFIVGTVREAAGSTYSCQKLVNDCGSSNNIEYGSCLGYFAGLSGWEIFLQANLEKHKLFCFPEKMSTGRLKKIFLKYTEAHPDELQKGASLCFYYAMLEAYPCKK